MFPQQTSAAVFVSRDQTIGGVSHGPEPRKDTPTSSPKHHPSDSMERQEMSLQRVEAQHWTGPSHSSHKHPKHSHHQEPHSDGGLPGIRVWGSYQTVFGQSSQWNDLSKQGPGRPPAATGWETTNSWSSHGVTSPFLRELDMEPFVDADKSVIVSHFHWPTSYCSPSPLVCQWADGRKSHLDAAFLLSSQNQTGKAKI